MRQLRALDLFCGGGGATKGLQRAGFHITGVDIRPQKRYCGDRFFQADALTFPLDTCSRCRRVMDFGCDCGLQQPWDLIWASPPCQAHTALRSLHPEREYPDLIPETRRRLVESGIPYVIENVPGAPLGETGCLIMLCATMFGLRTKDGTGEVRRHRLFECSFSIPLRPACQHNRETITVTGAHGPPGLSRERQRETMSDVGSGTHTRYWRRTMSVAGSTPQANEGNKVRRTWTTEQAREAMGIDWMPMKSLSQAVPPAYSEWIGKKAIEFLEGR